MLKIILFLLLFQPNSFGAQPDEVMERFADTGFSMLLQLAPFMFGALGLACLFRFLGNRTGNAPDDDRTFSPRPVKREFNHTRQQGAPSQSKCGYCGVKVKNEAAQCPGCGAVTS